MDDQRRRTEGNWFAGCVVWIDGLTDPPADDLEQLVVAGGGLVCDSRDRRATHIVAVSRVTKITSSTVSVSERYQPSCDGGGGAGCVSARNQRAATALTQHGTCCSIQL